MTRHYQKGDAGVAMVVMMVVLMVGVFWYGGMGHGDRGGHMSDAPSAERTEKTALELLDEAYARGEITREEYLGKREDLLRR